MIVYWIGLLLITID